MEVMPLSAQISQMAKHPNQLYFCETELARPHPVGAPLSTNPSCPGEVTGLV